MNIKTCVLILSVIALATVPNLPSQEEAKEPAKSPAKLTKLRDSWQAARKRVLDPIDKKYAEALEKLMKDFTRAGDLDSALAVKGELDKLVKGEDAAEEIGAVETLTIVKAVYGSEEQRSADKADDVTEQVREQIKDGKIAVKVHRSIFGDPNPFGPKSLVIEYQKAGSKKVWIKVVPANEQLTLP